MKLDFAINYMPIYSFYDPTKGFPFSGHCLSDYGESGLIRGWIPAGDYF
ncbi:hypothetical protein HFZ78_02225 [Priestia megaterium]|uniref:Uncharacterized protein n=1 Tax=Priestia megaterium TaxID=1404 RepID=A0A6H1NWX1_PRIMG|nr:hypothetical protein [Priestia megaterium]QIZ05707.1 hypothetical protein HFZ78_02225 [Priestia megaterium]